MLDPTPVASNLSALAVRERAVTLFALIVVVAAGAVVVAAHRAQPRPVERAGPRTGAPSQPVRASGC